MTFTRFKYLLFSLLILNFSNISAQQPVIEPCGYQNEIYKILKRNPDFIAWQNQWYKNAHIDYSDLQSAKRSIILADTLYYEIPVVFHVIYNTPAQNISTALLLSQLNELNLDYRKQNADTSRIRAIFKPLAADVKINFVLATKDPNGNVTTGINRVSSNVSTFATNVLGNYTENMKSTSNGGQDAWNPSKYLNIWICNMEYPNYVGIVYGFATPPTGAPNWDQFPSSTTDTTSGLTGVVLHYKIVGKNNPLASGKYKEGNTATHEVGHYLGLRHIWGDASQVSQGCNVDDGIMDTPNSKDKNYSCSNTTLNTCTDGPNDKPDMTENYMDYALDGCSAMFTTEQAYMMRYVLNNFRTGLPVREIIYDTLEGQILNTVTIYPNPSVNQQFITVLVSSNSENPNFNLALIDTNGKEVIKQAIKANVKNSFYIEPYAPGVYYFIITDSNGNSVSKQKYLILP